MPRVKKDTQKEVSDQRRSRRIAGLVPNLEINSEKSTPEIEVPRKRNVKRMGGQFSLALPQNETDGRPTKRSKQQESHSNTPISKYRPQKGTCTGNKHKGNRLSCEHTKKASLNGLKTSKSNSIASAPTLGYQSQNSDSLCQDSPKNLSVSLSCIETPSTSYSPSASSSTKCKRRSERVTKGPYHSTPYTNSEQNRNPKRRNLQSPFGDSSIVDETVNRQCNFTIYPDPSEIEQQASQLAGTASCGTPVASTEQRRSQRQSSISCRATRSNTVLPLSIVSPSTSYGSFAVPVKGQAFCECFGRKVDSRRGDFVCSCGEEDTDFNWFWDPATCSNACELSCDCRLAKFHLNYSCGTAACRGNRPMTDKQYFWEIKMTTSVYGTDMMIGVGTGEVNLNAHAQNFCSLLGRDFESWGLSYTGNLYHGGQSRPYGSKFGQGSIIGVHLDMWKGQLYFYKNRKPLGLACKGLYGKTLYPMISSTAARSAMKLTKAITCETTLQFFCCQVLRNHIPKHLGVVDVLHLPPGLRVFLENNFGWLLSSVDTNQPEDESF